MIAIRRVVYLNTLPFYYVIKYFPKQSVCDIIIKIEEANPGRRNESFY